MPDPSPLLPATPRLDPVVSGVVAIGAGLAQTAAHASEGLAVGVLVGAALLGLSLHGAPLRRGARDGALSCSVVTVGFAPQAGAAWMIAVAAVCFVVFGAALGIAGAAASRRGAVVAVLGLPATAAALEALNGLGPLGDYLGVAPSVTGLPILSLARFGGAPLVAAGAVGLGVSGLHCLLPGRRLAGVTALALWSLLVLGATMEGPTRPLRVAAVVPGGAPGVRGGLDVARELAALTRRAALDGALLVVWPEGSVRVAAAPEDAVFASLRRDAPSREPVRAGSSAAVWEVMRGAARDARVPLVAGVFVVELDQNLAVLIDGDGSIRGAYAKNHLIPGMERYTPGRAPPEGWSVAALSVPIGALICFDDCFRRGAATLKRQGAQLLALPTNDWPAVAARHRRLSQLRAAETGLPLLRSATGGISQLVDGRGRVLAWADAPAAGAPGLLLLGDVPIAIGRGVAR